MKETMDQNEELSLEQLYYIVKPYYKLMLLVSVVCALGAFIMTSVFVKPTYQSDALLIVNNRKNDESQSVTNDELTSARNLAAVYNIIIKSDAVLEPVIEASDLGLTSSQLAKQVKVSAVDNTQVIRVSVTDTNPKRAHMVAQEIVTVAPDIITDTAEAGSVKVVSLPQVPQRPVAPNKKMNMLVAFMLGAMGTMGFVFIQYFMDKTVRSVDDIESRFGLPVVGVIPRYDGKRGAK